MRRLLAKSLFLTAIFAVSLWAIDSDELPFGAMYLGSYNHDNFVRVDSMYFNFIIEYTDILDFENIDSLDNHGLMAVRGGMHPQFEQWNDSEAPAKYSWTNYGIIDVGNSNSDDEVKMIGLGGVDSTVNDTTWWVSLRDTLLIGDTLAGINTLLEERYEGYNQNYVKVFSRYFSNLFGGSKIAYTIDLQMKVDARCDSADCSDSMDVVAVVWYGFGNNQAHNTNFYWPDTIFAYQCSTTLSPVSVDFQIPETNGDIVTWYEGDNNSNPRSVTLYDNIRSGYGLTVEIRTTGEREVWIDELKISDDEGRRLIAGDRNAACSTIFLDYATGGYEDKILGWYLMDEPAWLNFMPFAHILKLYLQSRACQIEIQHVEFDEISGRQTSLSAPSEISR